jgi:hypothetical protein
MEIREPKICGVDHRHEDYETDRSQSRHRRAAAAIIVRREDSGQGVQAKEQSVGRDHKVNQGQDDEHRQH